MLATIRLVSRLVHQTTSAMVQLAIIVAFVVVWYYFQASSTQLTQMNTIALLLTLHYHTNALAARSASKRLRLAAEPEDDSKGTSQDGDGDEATSALRPVKRRRAAARLDSRSVSDAAGQSESQGASSGQLRKGVRGSPAPSDVVRTIYHTFLPANILLRSRALVLEFCRQRRSRRRCSAT